MKNILILFLILNFSFLPAYSLIEDEFIDKTLDKNLKIKNTNYIPPVDEFTQNNLKKNTFSKKEVSFDEKIPTPPKEKTFAKKVAIIDEKDFIPVKVKIKEAFSTKNKIEEGDFIEFETIEEIKIKNKVYPEKTTVKARIETISANSFRGIPADLTIGNFSIDNTFLQGEINKTGANRSLWLYPTIIAGDIFFFAGELLNVVKGGHAKIKPQEIFTIYLER